MRTISEEAIHELLSRLEPVIEESLANLPQGERRRLQFYATVLVREAESEPPQPEWWELVVALLRQAAESQGLVGQKLVMLLDQLTSLLKKRFDEYGPVSLQEITKETVSGVCLLSETLVDPQRSFVAPNALSLAQAHFSATAWFRAVYAGPVPVGFIMLDDDAEQERYFLWRFMIGRPYQGHGYGRQAIERLVEYVRTRPGADRLMVSCAEGEGSPEGFYHKIGFRRTGEVEGSEIVMQLPLTGAPG